VDEMKVFLFLLFVSFSASAQNTVISYRNQPPPAANAPAISAFSTDVCSVPISGSVSTTIIGVAGGTVVIDENCQRIKLARALNDLGLKVSAVSILCDDIRVWEAMEHSGTPCPIGGAVGDSARFAWFMLHPQRFKKLYGENFSFDLSRVSSANFKQGK
jgi:hypothetical protein